MSSLTYDAISTLYLRKVDEKVKKTSRLIFTEPKLDVLRSNVRIADPDNAADGWGKIGVILGERALVAEKLKPKCLVALQRGWKTIYGDHIDLYR